MSMFGSCCLIFDLLGMLYPGYSNTVMNGGFQLCCFFDALDPGGVDKNTCEFLWVFSFICGWPSEKDHLCGL